MTIFVPFKVVHVVCLYSTFLPFWYQTSFQCFFFFTYAQTHWWGQHYYTKVPWPTRWNLGFSDLLKDSLALKWAGHRTAKPRVCGQLLYLLNCSYSLFVFMFSTYLKAKRSFNEVDERHFLKHYGLGLTVSKMWKYYSWLTWEICLLYKRRGQKLKLCIKDQSEILNQCTLSAATALFALVWSAFSS